MEITINQRNGVYYLFDQNKNFMCSADSKTEALEEKRNFEKIFSEELIKLKEA